MLLPPHISAYLPWLPPPTSLPLHSPCVPLSLSPPTPLSLTGSLCGCPSPSLLKNQEVDLRELFSFDKLRESGRVNIITMAEFLEREAFTGQLGIQPREAVKKLNVEVSLFLFSGMKELSTG